MPTNDIGQDRFQARLTKELRIKGSMPAPVLAPEIVPVILIEGDRVENQHLQLEHRFACTLTLGAVAGEYYYFQLWNLGAVNLLVVVEEFGIGFDGTTPAHFDFGYADLTVKSSLALRSHYCLDSRKPDWIPRAGHAGPVVGTDNAGGLIQVFGRCRSMADETVCVQPGVVLAPGYGFSIWDNVANQSVQGYCIWRERRAMDGELS